MNFFDSINICFTKYFDFSGRASRSEFWYFTLFIFLYTIVIGFLLGIIIGIRYPNATDADLDYFFDTIGLFLVLPLILPSISVTARRFHDFGHSGWIQLVFYAAMGIFASFSTTQGEVLYLLSIVAFYIYASQSSGGENKYGAPL